MIVLDTNVISETFYPRPNATVEAWLNSPPDTFTITSITVAELFFGVELMPYGKRQQTFRQAVEQSLLAYRDITLDFGTRAAEIFGSIRASRHHIGRPIGVGDAMIASICLAHGLPLATRNTKDFEHLNLELINPWEP